MIVSTAATYIPRRWRTSFTGRPLYVIVAGVAQRGSRWIVSTRRSRSRIGPTLFPDPRNKVRVLTVAVLMTPRIRSVICWAVSIRLMTPCGIHLIKLNHCRADQQQGQNDLSRFLRGRRIAYFEVPARPGECANQFAQIRFTAAEYRRSDVKTRRMWKRRAHDRRKDRRKRSRPIGRGNETKFREQIL